MYFKDWYLHFFHIFVLNSIYAKIYSISVKHNKWYRVNQSPAIVWYQRWFLHYIQVFAQIVLKKKYFSSIYSEISLKMKRKAVMVKLRVRLKKKLGKSHVYKWFMIHKGNDEASCLDVLDLATWECIYVCQTIRLKKKNARDFESQIFQGCCILSPLLNDEAKFLWCYKNSWEYSVLWF